MSVTTTEHAEAHAHDDHGGGGHHETHEARDQKERLALWLFIGGDLVFLLLELFTWFYLKALNTGDMWRCAGCTAAHPGTDGLGNPITHQIATANPAYTLTIAGLAVIAALGLWGVESGVRNHEKSKAGGYGALSVVVLLAAIVVQCLQYGKLPFTTIDGAYASTFEFFMGSTLAHLILLAFLALGVWNNARKGNYDNRWYRTRLVRIFGAWIAISACILAIVMSAFS